MKNQSAMARHLHEKGLEANELAKHRDRERALRVALEARLRTQHRPDLERMLQQRSEDFNRALEAERTATVRFEQAEGEKLRDKISMLRLETQGLKSTNTDLRDKPSELKHKVELLQAQLKKEVHATAEAG
ncbi:hypothetical protein Q5752_003373 [Cryptotrichosporon argae]